MDNETIILECRRALSSYIDHFIVTLLTIFLGFMFWPFWLLTAFLAAWIVVEYLTQYIRLTDKRLLGHAGFIRSARMTTPLNRVGDVTVANGLWGKLLGYSTITITTTGNSEYVFHGMKDAAQFTDRLQEYLLAPAPADLEDAVADALSKAGHKSTKARAFDLLDSDK